MYGPGWPQSHTDSLVSASRVLGLDGCATMPGKIFFLFTCLCVPTGILLHHVYASACKSQRRVLDLLELELQVSHVMWVLGNTLRSSERAVRAHKG